MPSIVREGFTPRAMADLFGECWDVMHARRSRRSANDGRQARLGAIGEELEQPTASASSVVPARGRCRPDWPPSAHGEGYAMGGLERQARSEAHRADQVGLTAACTAGGPPGFRELAKRQRAVWYSAMALHLFGRADGEPAEPAQVRMGQVRAVASTHSVPIHTALRMVGVNNDGSHQTGWPGSFVSGISGHRRRGREAVCRAVSRSPAVVVSLMRS